MIDRIRGLESVLPAPTDELKEMALEYAATARERLSEGHRKLRGYVIKEPALALGLALGLGVLLGWLIKRR